MPKQARELSPLQVRRLTRPGLHAVGGVAGLHLQVSNSGARSWILRVVVGRDRPDFGLGGFPTVTLEAARDRARQYRDEIARGIDPRTARKAARDALHAAQAKDITFAEAAHLCHRAKRSEFRSTKHAADWINSLTTHAPGLMEVSVAAVDLPQIIATLEPIWTTKTETATRVRQRLEAVLAWATVNKYREGPNPARWDGNLEHALPKPSKVRKVEHHAAIPWQDVGAFMAGLRTRPGLGARALEFAILTAARSGEVRHATWDEIDLKAKLWTVPASRMKAGKVHRVPLSDAALALLKSLPRMEGSEYVFPAVRGGPLSDVTLLAVTRRMGVDATPHGFRSSFKDWARSSTAYPDEVSELALAHVNSDETRAAYARDELLPKRTLLMRDWARYCSQSARKGRLVTLNAVRA